MVSINIEKRHLFLISAIVVFLVGIGIVLSYVNPATGVGHELADVNLPSCTTGQILKKTSSGWGCGTDDGATGIYTYELVTKGSSSYSYGCLTGDTIIAYRLTQNSCTGTGSCTINSCTTTNPPQVWSTTPLDPATYKCEYKTALSCASIACYPERHTLCKYNGA
ncbi:MAG: hypothetical protein WC438_02285 [Candidatus Pacearchaeota archaeon]